MSETALAAGPIKENAPGTQNEEILVQYGCSMCEKIFLSEELCDQHITKCAHSQNTLTDCNLDQCVGKSDSASIFEDSGSDISDNEPENKKSKKCKIELNNEQEYVVPESTVTVYEATSQMLSENEMLITLPSLCQINDSTGGPLDFSNEVAIAFEQHAQELIDFEENLKPDEGAVTIENYDLEDFRTVDRDTTIEILSVFTSKSSQDYQSKSGENGDSHRIDTDNAVEDIETADNENNKVLTVLNTVDVNQLGAHDADDEVTIIDTFKCTEGETSEGSFEVEREVQAEGNENLEKMGVENRTPVDQGIEGDIRDGADSSNSQELDPKCQPDKAKTKKRFLPYKEIQKRGHKRSDPSSIIKKLKNSENVQNQANLEKYKEFIELHAKYKSDIQKKQINRKLHKIRRGQDEDFPEDKLYSPIVCKKEEKDQEEKPNELSVYEFYDEEEEKLKAQMRKNCAIEKEIKNRTCKFCKTIFNDPIEVLRHKRESHKFKRVIMTRREIEPYLVAKDRTECPLCFRKLGSKVFPGTYVKHMMTHCDEYNFQCRVCHLQFRRKDHWTIHEARHVVAPEVADEN